MIILACCSTNRCVCVLNDKTKEKLFKFAITNVRKTDIYSRSKKNHTSELSGEMSKRKRLGVYFCNSTLIIPLTVIHDCFTHSTMYQQRLMKIDNLQLATAKTCMTVPTKPGV